MKLDEIVKRCITRAFVVAKQEAQDNGIELGAVVGHEDTDKFGMLSGILRSYNDKLAYVEILNPSRWVKWNVLGMVEASRIEELTEIYLNRIAKAYWNNNALRRYSN